MAGACGSRTVKRAAGAGTALYGERAFHQLDQIAGDEQADTGVAGRRGAAVAERHEQAFELRRAHSGAVVGDRQGDVIVRRAQAERHRVAGPAVADRVGRQLEQHLMQSGRIGADGADIGRRRLQPQRDAAGSGLRGAEIAHAAQRGGRIHRLLLHVERAGFEAGDVEQVVDHRQQVPAGGADAADAFALHVGQRPLGIELQHLGEAEDGVQRRAQLVAHAGDEFAARAIGALGQRARLQGGAGAGPVGDIAPARHRALAAAVGLARHGMALEAATVGEFESVEGLDLGRLPPFVAAPAEPGGVDHAAGHPVDQLGMVETCGQRLRQAPEPGEPAVGEQCVA